MDSKDTNECIAEAIAPIIARTEETFDCVSEIVRFCASQAEKDYQAFLRDPYPVLAEEYGPELSSLDAEELRALIGTSR